MKCFSVGLLTVCFLLVLSFSAGADCSWTDNVGTTIDSSQPEVQGCLDEASLRAGAVVINVTGSTETYQSSVRIDMSVGWDNVTRLDINFSSSSVITDGLSAHPFLTGAFSLLNLDIPVVLNGNGATLNGHPSERMVEGMVALSGTAPFRITGFIINQGAGNGRMIKVFRIYGVIDNNTFNFTHDLTTQGISVWGQADAWSRPHTPGNAVYVEDNTFNFDYDNDGMLDGYDSAEYVFRYNQGYGPVKIGHHGRDSGAMRSTFFWVIRNNLFDNSTGPATNRIGQSRGGTGVFANNRITGNYNNPSLHLTSYRSCPNFEGTATGGSATVLNDSGANFAITSEKFNMYNMTDGSACAISSHTSTSVTCSDGLTGGDDNTWQAGDIYAVFYARMDWGACNGYSHVDGNTPGGEGYPCADQNGRTTGLALQPVYTWGNTYDGSPIGDAVAASGCNRATSMHILENRDYFSCDSAADCKADEIAAGHSFGWDFIPYAYPHPLRGGEPPVSAPARPTNLHIRQGS